MDLLFYTVANESTTLRQNNRTNKNKTKKLKFVKKRDLLEVHNAPGGIIWG